MNAYVNIGRLLVNNLRAKSSARQASVTWKLAHTLVPKQSEQRVRTLNLSCKLLTTVEAPLVKSLASWRILS